jgi:Collagen triple helix repeat (20 copies)
VRRAWAFRHYGKDAVRAFSKRLSRRVLVLAAALGVAAGASFATAAITTSSAAGVINACALNSVGTIRLVTDASECNLKFETPISWNTTGPAGPPGKDGSPGTNGANGADGAPCLPSIPACVGPKGDPGAPGTAGVSGYEIVTGTVVIKSDQSLTSVTISCPAGKRVIGGGADTPSSIGLDGSSPVQPAQNGGLYGWLIHASFPLTTPDGQTDTFPGYAICAAAG